MPRTYNDQKPVTPLKVVKLAEQRIPPDAKLYDIDDASAMLTEQYGVGYSTTTLRRLAKKQFVEGVHFIRAGKFLKFYLPAIQSWIVGG